MFTGAKRKCPKERKLPAMKQGGGSVMFWGCFAVSGTECLEVCAGHYEILRLSRQRAAGHGLPTG